MQVSASIRKSTFNKYLIKRTLLILDEAHQLGIDENGGDTTQSAKWVEEAGKRAEMVFVMSGTPYRTDGNPLLFAHPDFYGEIDKETGRARLLPDLEATYRDGVRDEYLRRFEYVLVDGGYTWVDIDGGEQEQNLKSGVASVYKAVNLEGIWQPLVDKFVERLEEQKSLVHNGLAGLIATGHQRQAKEVEQYLKTNYPHLKILTAVSDDGEKALQALRLFKEGKHDVLVTVSMAYVGYDHKPINTLLLLTHFRSEGYLTQLVARGLRMWSAIPTESQFCYVIAPDDPLMARFVESMRGESVAGYNEKQLKELDTNRVRNASFSSSVPSGYAIDEFLGDLRAMGIDPTSDLSPADYAYAEQLKKALNLASPTVELMKFGRALLADAQVQLNVEPARPAKTLKEQIEDAKRTLNRQVRQFAGMLSISYPNTTVEDHIKRVYARLINMYGIGTEEVRSVEEIKKRSETVLRWHGQGFMG